MEFISKSYNDTIKFAKKFSLKLTKNDIIVLNGELGAGKTAFAKGIAKGLKIKDTITSPTFTLMNTYKGDINLYHYDMYRINNEEELTELGLDEFLNADGICIIEWNKFTNLPKKPINIDIFKIDDNTRRIIINEHSDN